MPTYASGAFIFWRQKVSFVPMEPEVLHRITTAHDIPANVIPEYAGDRAQVARTLFSTSGYLTANGWLLRNVTNKEAEIAYAMIKEERNSVTETARHHQEDVLRWRKDAPEQLTTNGSAHDDTLRSTLSARYQELRGKIGGPDWTNSIRIYLQTVCHGNQMRPDGRIYWVPEDGIAPATKMQDFLASIGIDMLLCAVSPEQRKATAEAMGDAIMEEVLTMSEQAKALDTTTRKHTLSKRLDAYHDLRTRVQSYQQTLEIGTDHIMTTLDALEKEVETLLHVPRQPPSRGTTEPRHDTPHEPINVEPSPTAEQSDVAEESYTWR